MVQNAGTASSNRGSDPASTATTDRAWGIAVFLVSMGGLLGLMATPGHWSLSVPLGGVLTLAATFALFKALGAFKRSGADVKQLAASSLWPRGIEWLATGVALVMSLRLAVAGTLPWPRLSAALLIVTTFLWFVVASFRLGRRLDIFGSRLPLLQRHGFWLMAMHALVYLPLLGSYSLSDPWETHYGEVAREMLARDDWLSLWWAQDGWFWSKPVLDFWLQGLSFATLGVQFQPDQLLAGCAEGLSPRPEWAARMPVFLWTAVCVYVFYKSLSEVCSRRVGFLSALVLSTTPYWYLISHQTMTDMPYVAPLAAAMGLFLVGIHTAPDRALVARSVTLFRREYHFHAFHLVLGAVALLTLPQVAYLASLNLTLDGWQLGLVTDTFQYGSGGGNCGLPGNDPCRMEQPQNTLVQPAISAGIWALALLSLLLLARGRIGRQAACFAGAWLFVATSAMAKGAPGLVLPIAVGLVFIGATGRWRDLLRLEPALLLLIFSCIVLPWYVQMVMRHGPGFTDRLLFHDMYKRAFMHVHDTNTGDDVSISYYLWQLGYGLFPWSGLCAAGLLSWMTPSFKKGGSTGVTRSELSTFMGLWAVLSFSLFTVSRTKFHHYILPAVVPISALTALVLDDMLPKARTVKIRTIGYLSLSTAFAALFITALTSLFSGSVSGDPRPEGAGSPWRTAGLFAGAALLLAISRLFERKLHGQSHSLPRPQHDDRRFALLGIIGLVGVAVVGRDLLGGVSETGQARLMQLFTYQYTRPWPDTLSFSAVLSAFTVVSAVYCAALLRPKLRVHAIHLICLSATLIAAWGINVYLFRAAPHWGQRENVATYYRDRSSPDQLLVAFQMNWKGENFYTGNRLPAFVKTGRPFKKWLEKQRSKGQRVMYFTTEYSRIESLKRELGDHRSLELLVKKPQNNKFTVARVEL